MTYKPSEIEEKWIKTWQEKGFYKTGAKANQKNVYVLEMFPYPSGKLHMGHVRNYTIGDTHARFLRMTGHNVLYPMGYDSLGLPAENAARKGHRHPEDWTLARIEEMRGQQVRLGLSYDWDREVVTCKPDYYRWNQWIFLRLFERGLAYKKQAAVNWCEGCQTVLANEQVVEGLCWRCSTAVQQKDLDQWFFKITEYADELLKDLKTLTGWPEKVRLMQENWIGRSEGVDITFQVKDDGEALSVYTTRPDTVYGITYMVMAPEHPRVLEWAETSAFKKEILAYIKKAGRKSTVERTREAKDKSGVFTGRYAISPFTGENVPIWISDYVLMGYGTGAVMAVPAHDKRDFEFAKANDLPIQVVISPDGKSTKGSDLEEAFVDSGTIVNTKDYDGMANEDFKKSISDVMEKEGFGQRKVNFKLRDWLVSRQRYWGTPIPIIYCDDCGLVPVPEADLPIKLPKDISFQGQGNPLAKSKAFVETTCPKCNKPAKRETDTMDTFVDSSWYFLRFCSPKATDLPFHKEDVAKWLPVNQYIGGVEHAVLHLLYARFFTKVLRDLGLLDIDEPFESLLTQGMVLNDGVKMSKSAGNTVDPGKIISKYGADTARVFILFGGPVERDLEWSDKGVEGAWRFLKRVFTLCSHPEKYPLSPGQEEALTKFVHKTVQKVTNDIKRFNFNTAISKQMELVNFMYQNGCTKESIDQLLLLLSPFAPFITEELWHRMGHKDSIHEQEWPSFEHALTIDNTVTFVIQVNGKVRDKVELPRDSEQDVVEEVSLKLERIQKYTESGTVVKKIFVANKLLNIVVR